MRRMTAYLLSSLLLLLVAGRAGMAQNPSAEPKIFSFSHNVEHVLKTGDTIEAVLDGEKGGKATFDLGDSVPGIPMTEVSPGHYVGKYTAEPRIFIHTQVWVAGHLAKGGVTTTRFAGLPVLLEP